MADPVDWILETRVARWEEGYESESGAWVDGAFLGEVAYALDLADVRAVEEGIDGGCDIHLHSGGYVECGQAYGYVVAAWRAYRRWAFASGCGISQPEAS